MKRTKDDDDEEKNEQDKMIKRDDAVQEYVNIVRDRLGLQEDINKIQKGVFGPAYNWLKQLREKQASYRNAMEIFKLCPEAKEVAKNVPQTFASVMEKAIRDPNDPMTLEHKEELSRRLGEIALYNMAAKRCNLITEQLREAEGRVGRLKIECMNALKNLGERLEVAQKREKELIVLLGEDYYLEILRIWM
jgi:hypothetical protein